MATAQGDGTTTPLLDALIEAVSDARDRSRLEDGKLMLGLVPTIPLLALLVLDSMLPIRPLATLLMTADILFIIYAGATSTLAHRRLGRAIDHLNAQIAVEVERILMSAQDEHPTPAAPAPPTVTRAAPPTRTPTPPTPLPVPAAAPVATSKATAPPVVARPAVPLASNQTTPRAPNPASIRSVSPEARTPPPSGTSTASPSMAELLAPRRTHDKMTEAERAARAKARAAVRAKAKEIARSQSQEAGR